MEEILIIRQTNDRFLVVAEIGGSKNRAVFTTKSEADAQALKLQTEAGGPKKAKIENRDVRNAIHAGIRASDMEIGDE